MDAIESKLTKELAASLEMLRYWEGKSSQYWESWKGNSKTRVIRDAKKRVEKAESDLHKYYNKIGKSIVQDIITDINNSEL